MAGAKMVRGRCRYTVAGYTEDGETRAQQRMYIAKVPAGSAQENLRDYNRAGYRSARPWNDTPTPVFEGEAAEQAAPVHVTRPRQKRRETMTERLIRHAKKEKRDVAVCIVLAVVILMLVVAWSQKMVEGVRIQGMVDSYKAQTTAFEKENERLAQLIEQAKSGERIRNLAQNELNMLRPERAETVTIYIQTPENPAEERVQENDELRLEPLDILLGLLNVFHIGE